MKKAVLVLEDGSHYTGKLFGKDGESFGQLVFNSSMTGYQEILTDPCYRGKIVAFTYPVIGNYGFSLEDNESPMVQANGVIFKNYLMNPQLAKPGFTGYIPKTMELPGYGTLIPGILHTV